MAKILLVEDENNLREIYEARLKAEGFEIVSAKDGEEALAVAKAEKPDLIISDIMMPKISGFEMLDILRNTKDMKNIKIIMLTALGQNDDQQKASSLGADKYLVKSQVTLEDIVKSTYELLDEGGDNPPTTGKTVDKAQNASTIPKAAPPPEPATIPVPEPPNNPTSPPLSADPPADVQPKPVEAPVTPSEATPEPAPATPLSEVVDESTPVTASQPEAESTDEVAPLAEPLTADDYKQRNESQEPDEEAANNPSPPKKTEESTVAPPAPTAESTPNVNATPPPVETSTILDTAAQTDAETSKQEGAEVDAKIEDFVSGASSDASLPGADISLTDSDDARQDDTATDGVADQSVEENAEAEVETEITDEPAPVVTSDPKPEPEPQVKENIVITPSSSGLPDKPAIDEDLDVVSGEPSDNVTIAHKKVINPINDSSKSDIQSLLAIEQAKDGNDIQSKPVIGDLKTRPNPAPGANDASGIAL